MDTFDTETRFSGDVEQRTGMDRPVPRDHTRDAAYFEYSKAANPFGVELTPLVPFQLFPAALYSEGATRVVPLDISADLACEGPATGPGLCANFVRILDGDALTLEPKSTSMVFYVIRGAGRAEAAGEAIDWNHGDFFTMP